MKTEITTRSLETEKIDHKSFNDNRINRGGRRTLQPLQAAAGDKENLVSAGRAGKVMPPAKEVTIIIADPKTPAKKVKPLKTFEKKSEITADDLISEDGPSEGYWEKLAERRRVALEAALKENEELHERVKLLEEENLQCKLLLDETRALVDTLSEVLNDQSPNCEAEEKSEE